MMTLIKLAIITLGALANNTTIDYATIVDVHTHCLCNDVVSVDDGTDVWKFYDTDLSQGR